MWLTYVGMGAWATWHRASSNGCMVLPPTSCITLAWGTWFSSYTLHCFYISHFWHVSVLSNPHFCHPQLYFYSALDLPCFNILFYHKLLGAEQTLFGVPAWQPICQEGQLWVSLLLVQPLGIRFGQTTGHWHSKRSGSGSATSDSQHTHDRLSPCCWSPNLEVTWFLVLRPKNTAVPGLPHPHIIGKLD